MQIRRCVRSLSMFVVAACVAAAVMLIPASCYWQTPEEDTGDIAVTAVVPVQAAGIQAQQFGQGSFMHVAVVDTRTFEQFRVAGVDVYNRLLVEAVDAADIYPGITRLQLFGPNFLGLRRLPQRVIDADFRLVARSAARAFDGTLSGEFQFRRLPARRNYMVVIAAYNRTGPGEYDISVGTAQLRVAPSRVSSATLDLRPNRGILYTFLKNRYDVPVLNVYAGAGNVNDGDGNPLFTAGGVAVEYLGSQDSLHRHRLYLFEPGMQFDRQALYDGTVPGAGRLDPKEGQFVEIIVETSGLLFDTWPDASTTLSLSGPEGEPRVLAARLWNGSSALAVVAGDPGTTVLVPAPGVRFNFGNFRGAVCFDATVFYDPDYEGDPVCTVPTPG